MTLSEINERFTSSELKLNNIKKNIVKKYNNNYNYYIIIFRPITQSVE
jgi:hypothetical protein